MAVGLPGTLSLLAACCKQLAYRPARPRNRPNPPPLPPNAPLRCTCGAAPSGSCAPSRPSTRRRSCTTATAPGARLRPRGRPWAAQTAGRSGVTSAPVPGRDNACTATGLAALCAGAERPSCAVPPPPSLRQLLDYVGPAADAPGARGVAPRQGGAAVEPRALPARQRRCPRGHAAAGERGRGSGWRRHLRNWVGLELLSRLER